MRDGLGGAERFGDLEVVEQLKGTVEEEENEKGENIRAVCGRW